MTMIFDLLSTILRDVDTETGKKLGDPSFLATSSQEQVRLIPKSIKNDKLRILSLEAGAWTGKPTADDLLHPALN